ncbi:MAG: hypothetical protein AB1492_06125 [Bacillota bacterium]
MSITVRYLGALAAEAGCSTEALVLPEGSRLSDALQRVCQGRGQGFTRLVVDARGLPQPFLLVSLDGAGVPYGQDPPVGARAQLDLAIAVSGG